VYGDDQQSIFNNNKKKKGGGGEGEEEETGHELKESTFVIARIGKNCTNT
jgi:hypothetical protein